MWGTGKKVEEEWSSRHNMTTKTLLVFLTSTMLHLFFTKKGRQTEQENFLDAHKYFLPVFDYHIFCLLTIFKKDTNSIVILKVKTKK